MAKITKTTNELSTNENDDFEMLISKIKESEEISANISKNIKKLNELKSQFIKLSNSLLKIVNDDKVKALRESLKNSK